ncbi:hypothetical protein MP638_006877 [Amoeboaphelidium occidentale]|jgi:hypothetical protein|nr:hypothetical protein MP638_006877 [Amoeboaphelidium occidentale]
MTDYITIIGGTIALLLIMILIPLCPASIVCPPFLVCSLPLVTMLMATLGGLAAYMSSSSYGTYGSMGPGGTGMSGISGMGTR